MNAFLLLVLLVSPALAQPDESATCERGLNPKRIIACTELLRQEQSSDKLLTIHKNRGQAYSWSRQHEHAVKDYDAVLDIDPNDVEALYGRGWALENMQEHRRAIADADRLITLGEKGKRFAVHQLRCRALAALGKFDEAIQSCSDQLRAHALHIFYVDRGEVYLLAGQYDRAIEDFDAALKIVDES
jgi:tetratricopeptide (TPR) repeat protein